jgi:hypothetical protein
MTTAVKSRCRHGKSEWQTSSISILSRTKNFLLARTNYTAEGDFLSYANEDTDFLFTVNCAPDQEDMMEATGSAGSWINFTINYMRPETYIDEVSIELNAFNQMFEEARFFDEISGAEQAFSINHFQSEWKKINQLSLDGNADQYGLLGVTDAIVKDTWRWNYNRKKTEEWDRGDFYIAKVMFQRHKTSINSVQTICTWPDSIQIIVPRFVDEVVVVCELESQSLMARLLSRKTAPKYLVKSVPLSTIVDTGAFEKIELSGFSAFKLVDSQNPNLLALNASMKTVLTDLKSEIETISADNIIERSIL